MQKLSDILRNGSAEKLRQQWNETEAAVEYQPLPRGEYITHIIRGELETSRSNNTPGYKLTFRVAEGPYTGRLTWHDIWLTEAALPQAKRDLGKLGVTDPYQLEQPLPLGIRCRVRLVLHTNNDATTCNKVRWFEVISFDTPEPDAFAPATAATNAEGGSDEN